MEDLVGRAIAHFRVEAKLGEGGMGVVYRATDEKLRRAVALKVLPEGFAQDVERRRRFLREARLAAQLTQANIATVYDVGEWEGRVYIAMELVEGTTLRTLLRDGALPAARVTKLATQIARGLAKAHAKNVVHRDLKPENVMVSPEGEVKILDFGLAKHRETETSESAIERAETVSQGTLEGHVLGTPAYMSPEQAAGKPVDARTDVWAIGVMLYEMLSGRRPFEGTSTGELIAAILRDEPESLSKITPEAPEHLVAVVERCTAKSAGDRFETARELLDVLEAQAAGASGGERTPMPARTRRRGSRRWAVGALVALFGVGALLAYERSRGSHASAGAPASATPSSAAPITSSPLPKTASPEAAALYAEAMQAGHDGQYEVYRTKLRSALAKDPHFAAAHLRLALNGDAVHEHIAAANLNRESLDARDKKMLQFLEADNLGDGQRATKVKVARDLATALPDDPEALFWAAADLISVAQTSDDPLVEEGDALNERALKIDPHFMSAAQMRAQFAAQRGDWAGMLAAANRCLELAARGESCLRRRAEAYEHLGRCAELEQDARQIIAVFPAGPAGYGYLLGALHANGAPIEALRQVAGQQERVLANLIGVQESALAEEDNREQEKHLKLDHATRLAAYVGDLASAEAAVVEQERDLADSRDQGVHFVSYAQLVELYQEEGNVEKAAEVAEAYLRQRSAWVRVPAWSTLGEEPFFGALHRAGRSGAQIDAWRDSWLGAWRSAADASSAHLEWFGRYDVSYFSTPAEARAALAALPEYSPLPPTPDSVFAGGALGRLYVLGGDATRALPLLRARLVDCGNLGEGWFVGVNDEIERMRTRLALGQALEQTSDKEGACREYATILSAWGNAKPRSVTADTARARSKALGCR